jgi:hypothetical protein
MKLCDTQLVEMFEELGLEPEQIAQQTGFEVTSVKACLTQNSTKYREMVRTEKIEGFSDTDEEKALQVMRNLLNSDDEHIQLKAAKYVRDDKRGRLDVMKEIQKSGVSVIVFNTTLQKAKQARERAKSKIIDIAPEPKPSPSPSNNLVAKQAA